MTLVNLELVQGANPLGSTIVTVHPTGEESTEFVATDNELSDIEDRLRSWRLDKYGLVRREVTASLIEQGDIIPCFGMTVDLISQVTGGMILMANTDRTVTVKVHKNTMVQLHRRVR